MPRIEKGTTLDQRLTTAIQLWADDAKAGLEFEIGPLKHVALIGHDGFRTPHGRRTPTGVQRFLWTSNTLSTVFPELPSLSKDAIEHRRSEREERLEEFSGSLPDGLNPAQRLGIAVSRLVRLGLVNSEDINPTKSKTESDADTKPNIDKLAKLGWKIQERTDGQKGGDLIIPGLPTTPLTRPQLEILLTLGSKTDPVSIKDLPNLPGWTERGLPKNAHTLSNYVSALRKLLPQGALITVKEVGIKLTEQKD